MVKLNRFGSVWDRNERIRQNDDKDKIEKLLNQLGSSMQDLVAEGQLTEEQYAELLTLVNGLLKSGEVDKLDLSQGLRTEINQLRDKISKGEVSLNDLSPEVLAAINNGDGTPFEILSIPRDKSVSVEKTDFIDVSSNLVDAVNVKRDKEINLEGQEVESNGLGLSESIVRIKPGTDYVFKGVYSVALYDQTMNFSRTLFLYSHNNTVVRTFSDQEHYMQPIISMAESDVAQGNEGATLNPYEPFYRKLSEKVDVSDSVKEVNVDYLSERLKSRHIGDKEITTRKINFIEHPSNLFDLDGATPNKSLNADGELIDNSSAIVSDFIMIEEGQKFTVDVVRSFPLRLSYYDENKNHINQFYEDYPEYPVTITAPIGTVYTRYSVHRLSADGFQFNLGDEALPYEPYHKPRLSEDIEVRGVNHDYIDKNSDIKNLDSLIVDKYGLSYVDIDMLPKKELTSAASVMYSKFDDLANQYPEKIKKTRLRDSVQGKEIAVYDYNLNDVPDEKDNKANVVIVASVHGLERIPPYTVYDFLRILCENIVINNSLDVLRNDLQFRVIPIANPDGWDNDTRKNANGIDIARQFPADFIGDAVPPDASTYGGTEPLTEPEALNIKDIINENTISVIDFHNFSQNANPNYFYWIVGGSDLDISIGRNFIGQASKKLKDKWDFLPQSRSEYLGWSSRVPGGTPGRYATSLGINGATFESCMRLINDPDDTSYSKYVMTASLEGFINWLILTVKFSVKLD